MMKTLLRMEEITQFILAAWGFTYLGGGLLTFILLILLPDLSMVGYLVNPRLGAMIYNFVHHKALAVVIFLLGSASQLELVQLAGLILYAHSSMDRALGYGLKYTDDFKHTHLGWIGRRND